MLKEFFYLLSFSRGVQEIEFQEIETIIDQEIKIIAKFHLSFFKIDREIEKALGALRGLG
jgi:hypothetical protein